jgi:hypothetical protein
MAIGFLSLGIYLVRRDFKRRLRVFEHGLIDQRIVGYRVFRWDEVGQVRSQVIAPHGILQLSLKRQDGKKLGLADSPYLSQFQSPSLSGVRRLSLADLLAIIQQASYSHRLARFIRQYDAGQPVIFDKFQISSSGFHANGHVLRWTQVGDIDADTGASLLLVKTTQQRPWRTFSLVNQPDGDLLPELIAHGQGRNFSAFEGRTSPQMTAVIQTRRSRRRLLQWVILPLATLGIGLGINQARYMFGPGIHLDRGRAYFDNDNYAAALTEFDAVLAKAPGDPDILTWRGQAYRELGRFDAALTDYDAVLKTSPGDRLVLVLRGRVYYRQGDYQRALDQYNTVIGQYPSYYYAYCNRGFTYKKIGLKVQAIADFTIC